MATLPPDDLPPEMPENPAPDADMPGSTPAPLMPDPKPGPLPGAA